MKKLKNAKIGIDESIFSNLNNEYKEILVISKDLEAKLGYTVSEFDNNILWTEFYKKNKLEGLLALTYGYSGSDIERGTRVALLKAINTEILTYDIFYNSLKLVGGTAIHVERQDILSDSKQKINRTSRSIENKRSTSGPPEI